MASRSIKSRPSAKKKHPFVGVLAVLSILAAFCVAGVIGVYVLGDSWIGDLKDYDVTDVAELNSAMPTTVLASDEKTQLARFQVENRDPVELDGISKYVLQGTVATEDERFYDHGGFDLWASRALRLLRLPVQGVKVRQLSPSSSFATLFCRTK